MTCYRIVVSGMVQGVSYRYYAKLKALQLAIVGYAKNLPNGKVEILACGSSENLSKFIEYCRIGPNFAQVKKIEVEKIDRDDLGFGMGGFEIK